MKGGNIKIVRKINHEELKELVSVYYKNKLALYIRGTFGIGKSQTITEKAKELAKERKREFIDWNRVSKEKKREVYENPEKYFVLIDVRLSEYDSSDIKGLPDFISNGDKKEAREFIEWRSPFFAKLIAKKESDGILFFDEINNSTPLVMMSCYKIILDRVMNDEAVSGNWLIVGAGNLDTDRAFIHTLPAPLQDRFGESELQVPTIDEWTKNYAIPKRIDGRIIGFLNFEPSNLYKVDFKDNQKFVTPRGWERLNTLIRGVKDYKTMSLVCQTALGEGTAIKFVAFCKIQEKFKLEEFIKNPEKIEKLTDKETDVRYFLVTALAEKYRDKKVKFDTIIKVSKVFERVKNQEFCALLWRMCLGYSPETFKKDFLSCKENKLIERFGELIN